ncbi:amidohydrolase family protein [Phenylobacterium sp.]|uniref:amidohydrolase family protein n=1 Tax=Phenylobacterium sp. TaxID=1871053 RepID=UPI002FC61D7C
MKWVLAAGLLGCVWLTTPATAAERYDLVISDGQVMDPESGLRAVRTIGVKDGKIAAISEGALTGARTINAKGKIVGPGFIDLHAHGQSLLAGRVQAFDGVTTAIEAEAGQFPVDKAYRNAAQEGRATNYGFTVSWNLARAVVLAGVEVDGTWKGGEKARLNEEGQRAATAPEVERILALLDQGLDQGAPGIGLALGYMPGAQAEEVFAVSQLAARRNAEIFTHIRSTTPDFSGTEEVIANAVSTGAHWHIMHVYWNSPAQMELIAGAMKAGAPITPETKGLLTGSTFVGAPFMRPEAMKKMGKTPDLLYYGRHVTTFEELAEIQAKDPDALIINLHKLTDDNDVRLREETARRIRTPGWTLASDAMPWTNFKGDRLPSDLWPLPADAWAHPRSAGNFTRVIQKYVMEWKLVDMMDVFRAASLNPALELERHVPMMRAKGRVKVGADADLLVFDPVAVRAVATERKPGALSVGMDYVIVNGAVVIDNGKLDVRALPGRPILNTPR